MTEQGTLYTLDNKPDGLVGPFRKKTMAFAKFIDEPFSVEMQEGVVHLGPNSEGWDGGYWLVYPDDGSKPYAWSPKFKRENMVPALPPAEPEGDVRINCASPYGDSLPKPLPQWAVVAGELAQNLVRARTAGHIDEEDAKKLVSAAKILTDGL